MQYRQLLSSCALALLLTSMPAPAAPPTSPAVNGYNQQPSLSTHGAPSSTELADNLLKALTRRSVQLLERYRAAALAAPPAEAQTHRARLSSRMAGSATQRTNGSSVPANNLAEYLVILSRTTRGGLVTGRFSDWRAPSVYRSVGGRHNGYDVALKAGSQVVVGWPGRVTSITNWYGREYGITVVSPDGFHTTYGHLSPGVRVGQTLEPGDVVGTIVHDHVDIKMRDASGQAIDFARGVPLIQKVGEKGPVASTLVAGVPGTGAETSIYAPLAGPDWTQRPDAVKTAITYVQLRIRENALVAAGSAAPVSILAQVRHEIAETRAQLAVEEIPEEVLLAAFIDPQSPSASFSVSDVSDGTNSNALADWLRRQQVGKDAHQALPQLQELLKDLNS